MFLTIKTFILIDRKLNYGVYLLNFFSRMWDDDDEDPNWTRKLPFEGDAYTFIEILPTPLVPALVGGSLSYITRGKGQFLNLEPYLFSYDPDYPEDKVRFKLAPNQIQNFPQ